MPCVPKRPIYYQSPANIIAAKTVSMQSCSCPVSASYINQGLNSAFGKSLNQSNPADCSVISKSSVYKFLSHPHCGRSRILQLLALTHAPWF